MLFYIKSTLFSLISDWLTDNVANLLLLMNPFKFLDSKLNILDLDRIVTSSGDYTCEYYLLNF